VPRARLTSGPDLVPPRQGRRRGGARRFTSSGRAAAGWRSTAGASRDRPTRGAGVVLGRVDAPGGSRPAQRRPSQARGDPSLGFRRPRPPYRAAPGSCSLGSSCSGAGASRAPIPALRGRFGAPHEA
jgi:hypothetical protein